MTETIYDYFLETVNKFPGKAALMYKKAGSYINIKYKDLRDYVDSVAKELRKFGIGKGTSGRHLFLQSTGMGNGRFGDFKTGRYCCPNLS